MTPRRPRVRIERGRSRMRDPLINPTHFSFFGEEGTITAKGTFQFFLFNFSLLHHQLPYNYIDYRTVDLCWAVLKETHPIPLVATRICLSSFPLLLHCLWRSCALPSDLERPTGQRARCKCISPAYRNDFVCTRNFFCKEGKER